MKSLLHCHLKNLHSIILGHTKDGNVVRLFIADEGHTLNRNTSTDIFYHQQKLTIHDHKSDITIYPVTGEVWNISVTKTINQYSTYFNAYEYQSSITTGKGAFIRQEHGREMGIKSRRIKKPLFIPHNELHTVCVTSATASWIVCEGPDVAKGKQIAWSSSELSSWTDEGLYEPMSNEVREQLLDKYLHISRPQYTPI